MKRVPERLLDRARACVSGFARERDLESRLLPFAELRWDGSPPRVPALHIDDFSGIPFLQDISGVEKYQHRARLRAAAGDIVAAALPVCAGYEDYCRERLGLAPVEWLAARPVGGALALARSCSAEPTLGRLVDLARRAGGLAVHPFMGIEEVWELARRIAAGAAVPVTVQAPPPPSTWIANDKAAFHEIVERVLGPEWLVETRTGADVQELTSSLVDLAGRHDKVGLKRLRCASAMGNVVWDSERLLGLELADVEAEVDAFLSRTEWEGDEEVLAVAWEETEVSPSAQLWIPPAGSGEPRLDGLYEQILAGEHKVFVGSRPSGLPRRVNEALAESSLRVAAALQALAYAGRCSFDFLLVGDPEADFELRLVECNGRWGGTSTPMALLDRIFPGGRPPYRAQDVVRSELRGLPFTELLERAGDEAFDVRTGRGRYLFYNTGPLAEHGKFDAIAIGKTQAEAETALERDLPRLLGCAT